MVSLQSKFEFAFNFLAPSLGFGIGKICRKI